MSVHELVEKPFGAPLAHDEMVMHQKKLPILQSINLLVHDKFIFKNKDFSKIEWQQENAKNIFGVTAKDMEEMPVHLIILHFTPSAKQRLKQFMAQKNHRSFGKWLLWKHDNPSINQLQNIEIYKDYFYFYTLSNDTAKDEIITLLKNKFRQPETP